MKSLIATAVLFASTAATASVSFNQSCWDGTFGYNYARAVTTERGIELSLVGNNLEIPRLFSSWGQSIGYESFSRPLGGLHIVLPNNAEQKGETIVASSKQSGGDLNEEGEFVQVLYPTLWLSQTIRDLGKDVPVLTDIALRSVQLEVSPKEIQLKIVQNYGAGEPPVQTIKVSCMFDHAPENVNLPERLAEYLDARAPR